MPPSKADGKKTGGADRVAQLERTAWTAEQQLRSSSGAKPPVQRGVTNLTRQIEDATAMLADQGRQHSKSPAAKRQGPSGPDRPTTAPSQYGSEGASSAAAAAAGPAAAAARPKSADPHSKGADVQEGVVVDYVSRLPRLLRTHRQRALPPPRFIARHDLSFRSRPRLLCSPRVKSAR